MYKDNLNICGEQIVIVACSIINRIERTEKSSSVCNISSGNSY